MTKPQFFSDQLKFRKWLEKNHNKKDELLVGFYKKNSGKPSVTWEESVDQALCFGWIDGIRKSLDEVSYSIRFTPRKNNSKWSTKNINRVEELIKLKLMQPSGLAVYNKRKEEKSHTYSFEQRIVELDKEFELTLKKNERAYKFFQAQIPSYRKPAIHWVMSAKQEKTRLQRLGTLIKCSEAGELIPPLRWGKIKINKPGKD
jgi:uncharacterized protein YdeI (YjbR/CyaY-like superfamily)